MSTSAAPRGGPRAGAAAGGASADTPPFFLPGSHFVSALVFLVAGSAALVLVAPDLSRGAFLLPRVEATTHLFTLGWITTMILGALYQFLPVALGVGIASKRLAYVTLVLHLVGVTLLVVGLASGRTGVLVPGAASLSTGLLLFAGNLAVTLRRAPRGGLTRRALIAATVFLVAVVLLGAALAGNLRWGYLGGHRLLAMAVHLHVALLGWVLLVIVGVSKRLLPMFMLSHGAPEWPAEASLWLLTAGVALLLVGHHGPWMPVLLGAALLGGAGVAAFLLQVLLYLRNSKKPELDAAMKLALAGCAFLAVALGLAPFALYAGAGAPRLATVYVGAIIVGGFTPFVAGHLYRILPFLTWFHRYGPLVGTRELPRVSELLSQRVASGAAVLLVGGAAVLLAGVFPLGSAVVVRMGAWILAAGSFVMAAQMFELLARRVT